MRASTPLTSARGRLAPTPPKQGPIRPMRARPVQQGTFPRRRVPMSQAPASLAPLEHFQIWYSPPFLPFSSSIRKLTLWTGRTASPFHVQKLQCRVLVRQAGPDLQRDVSGTPRSMFKTQCGGLTMWRSRLVQQERTSPAVVRHRAPCASSARLAPSMSWWLNPWR